MATEIHNKMGAGDKKDHLLLCLHHLGEDVVKKKLPAVYENAKTFANVDPLKDPIPVAPSVHYTMGGIPTNRFCEVISKDEQIVPGLMAVGETACMSIHGANRLGCNSLLDIVVFGKVAIDKAYEIIQPGAPHKQFKTPEVNALEDINKLFTNNGTESVQSLQKQLKSTMSTYAGVFRTEELLTEGMKNLQQITNAAHEIQVKDNSMIWNTNLIEAIELENLIVQGTATMQSALERNESRGSHFRKDCQGRNDEKWLKHSIVYYNNDKFNFSTRNIRIGNSVKYFKPENRNY